MTTENKKPLFLFPAKNLLLIQDEFYNRLKKRYPNLRQYTNSQIKNSIYSFNKLLTNTILNERDGVTLPEHMGNLMIATYGKRTQGIDRKSSKELGIEVHHQNRHSMGYGGWVFYIRSLEKYNFINCHLWYFKPCRKLSRGMAEMYRNNWKKYVTIPNTKHIEKFIRTYWTKERTKTSLFEEFKNYNEFAGLI